MKYSDQQRIRKIYDYASRLNYYVKANHIEREDLLTDFSLQWLVTTPLYNIGEHAYNLSDDYNEYKMSPTSISGGGNLLTGGELISPASLKGQEEVLPSAKLEQWPYKAEHKDIPWTMISGLRHRLVHDYDGTNWNVIVEVVFEEIPVLVEQMKGLLEV